MDVQTRTGIFLFLVVMVSSEEVKKNLTGKVGGSITLPDPVEEDGFLLFGGKIIAMMNDGKIKIYDEAYKDKVLWNSSTGLFTITRLQRSNSGIYAIDSKTGKAFFTSYKLTVYDPVSTPAVETLNVSAESCTLQCFVQKAEETTLLWYKDEQILNQSSSSVSLPLTVLKKDFSSSYRCVAANPADQKTSLVNMTACGAENEQNIPNNRERHYVVAVVIPIALILIVLLVVLYKWKCSDKNKKTTIHQQVSSEAEVQYSEIVVSTDRRHKSEPSSDSSEPVDKSNLTTVYDKLEAHRLSPNLTVTADHVRNRTPNTVYMNT